MPTETFHFLNVKDGDCSIIEHRSGHVSVIDVCNAERVTTAMSLSESLYLAGRARAAGNFRQKEHPVNPVEYLHQFNISSVFRFVLTHPDMDHMDGIKDFFGCFAPANFYDTDNNKELTFDQSSPYKEEDWLFYEHLRDTRPHTDPRRLTLFSGDNGIHRTKDWNGQPPGDDFHTLAPTPELVQQANETGDYNDLSYVILYWSSAGRILLSGDSHDWSYPGFADSFPFGISVGEG